MTHKVPNRVLKGTTMRAVGAMILIAARMMGQNGPSMLGSSYVLPSPVTVAPGQLVTLIMEGVDTGNTPIVRAPSTAFRLLDNNSAG